MRLSPEHSAESGEGFTAPLLAQQSSEEQPAAKAAVGLRAAIFSGLALAAVCACAALREAKGPRGGSVAPLQEMYGSGSSFCDEDTNWDDCWSKKPPASTPPCTLDSGTSTCRCEGAVGVRGLCDIDDSAADPPTIARCTTLLVYTHQDDESMNAAGEVVVVASGGEPKVETFCRDMEKDDQWAERHLVKLPSDGESVSDASYWKCKGGYTWHEGQCMRKQRFIGDTCWDPSLRHPGGACVTGADQYAVACFKGRCLPRMWVEEHVPCECAWVGWNFVVACSAKGDQCGGHACVLSTEDMKKYCDYGTNQTW